MSATQRRLTDEENLELDQLTAAIDVAMAKRRDWLDAKMIETSRLQVGDDIYDIESGLKLGVISKLYRYWNGRNDLLDASVECHYQYEERPRSFDNTSRQPHRRVGTREDVIEHRQHELRMMELGFR